MAKKITLLMIVMLLVSALVFVSCSQDTKKGDSDDDYTELDLEEVVNELGTTRDISEATDDEPTVYFYNGSFDESTTSTDVVEDGSTTSIIADPDDENNSVLSVTTTKSYGCVYVDLTKYYGRGKSFYIEASFKSNGGTNTKKPVANITFTVCSGAVQAEADRQYAAGHTDEDGPGQYYSYDEIYGSPALADADAKEIFKVTTNKAGEDLSDGNWHKVAAVIDAVEIDDTLQAQTKKYKASELTMAHFYAVFYVGQDESDLNGYSYYMDGVKIIDLNDDLDRGGQYEPEEEDPQAT